VQFVNEHLAAFGAGEIPRAAYHRRLEVAVNQSADFSLGGIEPSVEDILQSIAQTS
jgi:leucyl/phenylalanyl-tRNA--protein transferase